MTTQPAETETDPQSERRRNRYRSASWVLERLQSERPDVWARAYVVGRWVWVEFPDDARPDEATRDFLKRTGFSWSRNRRAWQHCGGVPRPRASHDPRFVYGAVPARALGKADDDAAGTAVA